MGSHAPGARRRHGRLEGPGDELERQQIPGYEQEEANVPEDTGEDLGSPV